MQYNFDWQANFWANKKPNKMTIQSQYQSLVNSEEKAHMEMYAII